MGANRAGSAELYALGRRGVQRRAGWHLAYIARNGEMTVGACRSRRPPAGRDAPGAEGAGVVPLGAGWRMCCKRRARNRRGGRLLAGWRLAAQRGGPHRSLARTITPAQAQPPTPGRSRGDRTARKSWSGRRPAAGSAWPALTFSPARLAGVGCGALPPALTPARSGRSTATRSSRLAAARAARRAGHAWRATAARRGRGAVAARRAAVRQRHGDVRRAARRKRQRRVALYLSAPARTSRWPSRTRWWMAAESIFCGDSMSRKRSSSPTTRRTRFKARRSSSTRKAPARPDAHPGRDRAPAGGRWSCARTPRASTRPTASRSTCGARRAARCCRAAERDAGHGPGRARARSMACMVAGPRRRWRCGLGGRVGG